MKQPKIRYYIGKRQYVPDESDLLCASERDNYGNLSSGTSTGQRKAPTSS